MGWEEVACEEVRWVGVARNFKLPAMAVNVNLNGRADARDLVRNGLEEERGE
jgi:hypothetical protein